MCDYLNWEGVGRGLTDWLNPSLPQHGPAAPLRTEGMKNLGTFV